MTKNPAKENKATARWSRLDNVAKIFPATRVRSDTQVFRMSCELHKPIRGDLLQQAAEQTLALFPIYRSVLKRGFFWYYLEESDIRPIVRREYKKACAPLYFPDQPGLLFEVTFFQARINLEVFHVLSDGAGAMQFFKSLIVRYLSLRFGFPCPPEDFDASSEQLGADSFDKHYDSATKTPKRSEPPAFQLRGWRHSENRLGLICGRMSVGQALSESRSRGVTLTNYLCAGVIAAIVEDASVRELKNPITACIPVDLRRFLPSSSMRNFFSMALVGYTHDKGDDFDAILQKLRGEFERCLSPERLLERMNGYVAIEKNLLTKMIPLLLKDAGLRLAYRRDQKKRTFALSNIGTIHMPPEAARHIRAFDIFTGTNQLQLCVCSFGDTLSVTFSSPFASADIPRGFFRRLSAAGIGVEISCNHMEGREDE